MSEPLALVPLAAAARGGTIDSLDARQLVAAGLTLLQRCAPLVRALSPGKGAVLLPDSAAYLVALAACEGRSAVLLDPNAEPEELQRVIAVTNARVVFTLERFAGAVPGGMPRVLLDAAPGHATFVHQAENRVVDLGSHFGFAIEGEGDVDGRDEEAIVARDEIAGGSVVLTHRALIAGARSVARAAELTSEDRVLAAIPFSGQLGLTASLVAPLLAGAHVTTSSAFAGEGALEHVERSAATVIVGEPASYSEILTALHREGKELDAPALRLALLTGAATQPELGEEWRRATGVELLPVSGIPELDAIRLP